MSDESLDTRARIVRAASELLASGGRDAVSSRAVSAAAGVQAPTIYRQFGDMRGLLDAVAHQALIDYLAIKHSLQPTSDPVADLRKGWEGHVAYGLANPAAYQLVYSDPDAVAHAPAKLEAEALLLKLVARVAEAGRLKVSVPHAASLVSAAGRGVVLSLISTPVAERDVTLADSMFEGVLATILTHDSPDGSADDNPADTRVAARAVSLRAVMADAPDVLSPAEQQLLGEWLDRLATRG